MMLAHPEINHVFDFEIPYVNTLIIENRRFLRELLQDFRAQLEGNAGQTVLSERDTPIDMARHSELLHDFVPFSMNRKPLLTKVTAFLERAAMQDDRYTKTRELLQNLEAYILELAEELPCEFNCTKVSMNSILKAVGLEIFAAQEDPLEILIDYMELVRELDRDKLFILMNFRAYFDDAETESFMRTIIDHDLRVLMIESSAYPLLCPEKRLTIDADLCEF